MNIRFTQAALVELRDHFDWYESQRPGLGGEFVREAAAVVDHLELLPLTGRQVAPDVRKHKLARFPYAVFYSHRGNDLTILAILHLHRNPKRWEFLSNRMR